MLTGWSLVIDLSFWPRLSQKIPGGCFALFGSYYHLKLTNFHKKWLTKKGKYWSPNTGLKKDNSSKIVNFHFFTFVNFYKIAYFKPSFISLVFADRYWCLTKQNGLFFNFRKFRHDFEVMAPTNAYFLIHFLKFCLFCGEL